MYSPPGEMILRLPSNSSLAYFPRNTLQSYQTQLDAMIKVDNTYEVGLLEIFFPLNFSRDWISLTSADTATLLAITYGDDLQQTAHLEHIIRFPNKPFPSLRNVAEFVNEEIRQLRATLPAPQAAPWVHQNEVTTLPTLKFDSVNKRFSVYNWVDREARRYLRLVLSASLASLFGFAAQRQFPPPATTLEGVVRAPHPVTHVPTHTINTMYVYSDLIQPQFVGDTRAKLLRIVQVEGEPGQMTRIAFQQVQYFPLARDEFSTVAIDLRTSTGQKIPFGDTGEVICCLHLRRSV